MHHQPQPSSQQPEDQQSQLITLLLEQNALLQHQNALLQARMDQAETNHRAAMDLQVQLHQEQLDIANKQHETLLALLASLGQAPANTPVDNSQDLPTVDISSVDAVAQQLSFSVTDTFSQRKTPDNLGELIQMVTECGPYVVDLERNSPEINTSTQLACDDFMGKILPKLKRRDFCCLLNTYCLSALNQLRQLLDACGNNTVLKQSIVQQCHFWSRLITKQSSVSDVVYIGELIVDFGTQVQKDKLLSINFPGEGREANKVSEAYTAICRDKNNFEAYQVALQRVIDNKQNELITLLCLCGQGVSDLRSESLVLTNDTLYSESRWASISMLQWLGYSPLRRDAEFITRVLILLSQKTNKIQLAVDALERANRFWLKFVNTTELFLQVPASRPCILRFFFDPHVQDHRSQQQRFSEMMNQDLDVLSDLLNGCVENEVKDVIISLLLSNYSSYETQYKDLRFSGVVTDNDLLRIFYFKTNNVPTAEDKNRMSSLQTAEPRLFQVVSDISAKRKSGMLSGDGKFKAMIKNIQKANSAVDRQAAISAAFSALDPKAFVDVSTILSRLERDFTTQSTPSNEEQLKSLQSAYENLQQRDINGKGVVALMAYVATLIYQLTPTPTLREYSPVNKDTSYGGDDVSSLFSGSNEKPGASHEKGSVVTKQEPK